MGKIQHIHQGKYKGKPQCNQRILGTKIESVGNDLFHAAYVTESEGLDYTKPS